MKNYLEQYAKDYHQEKAEKADLDAKRDYHRRLADKYTRLAEMHQKKADKVPYYGKTNASWLDVLNALCDDVSAIVGYPHTKPDRTFGLRCETFVSWVDGDPEEDMYEKTVYMLCVTPDSTKPEDFALSYDTGEHKGRYAAGTIGYLNGFDNVTAPLPLDAEKVAEILISKAEAENEK